MVRETPREVDTCNFSGPYTDGLPKVEREENGSYEERVYRSTERGVEEVQKRVYGRGITTVGTCGV